MKWIAAAVIVWLCGGLASALGDRSKRLSRVLGPSSAIAGALLVLVPACTVLLGGNPLHAEWPWAMPFGAFRVAIDRLSAFFLVPIAAVTGCAALFGSGYLADARRPLGTQWFFYGALAAAMTMVVVARDVLLFLLAWEAMTLSSFFLVVFESERPAARKAGWIYLVASHIGAAFLLTFFVAIAHAAGSGDFDALRFPAGAAPMLVNAVFLCAVIGFGTKAGFMPMHIWLPAAHPEAPSHVSAVMSGVMIKTGIYGLVRALTFLGAPPAFWGWLLIGFGVLSGIMGILMAMAQHDLKRMLAYSSIENIGIVALGIGLGTLGIALNLPVVASVAFAGGLLHAFNHSVFKSLLFMGAGSIYHATGTRELDQLGGLIKRMPGTGASFVTGSAAIAGLPPFNGFVSEFLIYFAALHCVVASGTHAAAAGMVVLVSLALTGCLAAACFSKTSGIALLGEPRTPAAAHAHESSPLMTAPLCVLALACAAMGLAAPHLARVTGDVLAATGLLPAAGSALATVHGPLTAVVGVSAAAVALAMLILLLRAALLRRREVSQTVTWDCGYVKPAASMQYTASSFADPLLRVFHVVLRTRHHIGFLRDLFPGPTTFATETPDISHERVYTPLFDGVHRTATRFHWIQHGRLNLYVLSIALTLLMILAWKMRG